jgi:predicted metallopeptidase
MKTELTANEQTINLSFLKYVLSTGQFNIPLNDAYAKPVYVVQYKGLPIKVVMNTQDNKDNARRAVSKLSCKPDYVLREERIAFGRVLNSRAKDESMQKLCRVNKKVLPSVEENPNYILEVVVRARKGNNIGISQAVKLGEYVHKTNVAAAFDKTVVVARGIASLLT